MTAMRRGLGLVLGVALLVGGGAACSDEGSATDVAPQGGGAVATETGGAESGGSTGNAEVDAYCAAVDEYRVAVDAQLANPQDMAAQDRAFALSDALVPKLAAVGDPTQIDPDAAYELEQCMIRAATG